MAASEQSPQPVSQSFSLGELAEAYRKSGTSGKYVTKKIQRPNMNEEVDNVTIEGIEMDDELSELSQLDEMDTTQSVNVFAGEDMREYQGVVALNGQEYIKEKYPLRQGYLVEIRRYFRPSILLMQ